MRTFTFSYSSLLPSKFNNRVVCISISRPVCDSSLHTSPLCLEGFLRSERISLLLWLQKHAERFQSNQPVWRLIKANIRMAGDTSPPQKISNETQQLSWFTSFATVKKTPRKHPLYSGCASKSALMNVTLIGVLIGSNRCLMSVLFVIFHTQTDDLRLLPPTDCRCTGKPCLPFIVLQR